MNFAFQGWRNFKNLNSQSNPGEAVLEKSGMYRKNVMVVLKFRENYVLTPANKWSCILIDSYWVFVTCQLFLLFIYYLITCYLCEMMRKIVELKYEWRTLWILLFLFVFRIWEMKWMCCNRPLFEECLESQLPRWNRHDVLTNCKTFSLC